MVELVRTSDYFVNFMINNTSINMSERRKFLKTLATLTAGMMIPFEDVAGAISAPRDRMGELLPLRKLGKTGIEVTMLGIGGAHVGRAGEKEAQALLEAAIEGGIRFFDNAEMYNSGGAETKFGKYLVPKYRDIAFIMSKTTGKDAKTVQQHLEDSLRRLKQITWIYTKFTPLVAPRM